MFECFWKGVVQDLVIQRQFGPRYHYVSLSNLQVSTSSLRQHLMLLKHWAHPRPRGWFALVHRLERWFATEARRLSGLLRADNAAHVNNTAEDGARPKHVVESSGLLYLLLHSSLNRMSSHHLQASADDWMQFIAAAAAHGDFELRAIAPHAMSLCCCAHPVAPTLEEPKLWSKLPMVRALQPLLCEGAIEKELEKAFSAGLKPAIVANFFILLTGGDGSSGLYREMSLAAKRALGLAKPEIRTAARSSVASFLTLEAEAELVVKLKNLKVLAGPATRKADAVEADEAVTFCRAVSAMACMLLAAADCGVPRWSGQAIQAVAPYGKTGSWAMYLVFASFLCNSFWTWTSWTKTGVALLMHN